MFDINIGESLGALQRGPRYSTQVIRFTEVSQEDLNMLIDISIRQGFSFNVEPSEEE